jgi:hypothetical protein
MFPIILKILTRLIIYRVISRPSSNLVAALSNIDLVEVDVKACLAPESDKSAAKLAIKPGGLIKSWPTRSITKPSIQLTDFTSETTWPKQETNPPRNTINIKPLRYGEATNIGDTAG